MPKKTITHLNDYKQKIEMKKVENWNARAKIGDLVEYIPYAGAAPIITKTRSPAVVLGGHTAVVNVENISGCVGLDFCRLITEKDILHNE